MKSSNSNEVKISRSSHLKNRKKELIKELAKVEKMFLIQNQRILNKKNFQKFKQAYLYYGQFEIDTMELEDLKKLQEKIEESQLSKFKKEKIIQLIAFKIEEFD